MHASSKSNDPGVTKPVFSVPLFSQFFPNNQNNGYLSDVTFIVDRYHRRSAAETPDKYERDQRYLTYIFAKSRFPVMEKLTNWASVTPTSGHLLQDNNDLTLPLINVLFMYCPILRPRFESFRMLSTQTELAHHHVNPYTNSHLNTITLSDRILQH